MTHPGRFAAGAALLLQIAAACPAGAAPAPQVSPYILVRRAEIAAILTSVTEKTDHTALETVLAEPLTYAGNRVYPDGRTITSYIIPARDIDPADVKDHFGFSETRYADGRAGSFGVGALFGLDRPPDCVLLSDVLWSAGDGGWVESGRGGSVDTTDFILHKAKMELRIEVLGPNAGDPTHLGADRCVTELKIYTPAA